MKGIELLGAKDSLGEQLKDKLLVYEHSDLSGERGSLKFRFVNDGNGPCFKMMRVPDEGYGEDEFLEEKYISLDDMRVTAKWILELVGDK